MTQRAKCASDDSGPHPPRGVPFEIARALAAAFDGGGRPARWPRASLNIGRLEMSRAAGVTARRRR